MKKAARRIVAKVYRTLAMVDIVIPLSVKESLEAIVLDELKLEQKRGAFFGREENDGDANG